MGDLGDIIRPKEGKISILETGNYQIKVSVA
jgi:hypothetical protein